MADITEEDVDRAKDAMMAAEPWSSFWLDEDAKALARVALKDDK